METLMMSGENQQLFQAAIVLGSGAVVVGWSEGSRNYGSEV